MLAPADDIVVFVHEPGTAAYLTRSLRERILRHVGVRFTSSQVPADLPLRTVSNWLSELLSELAWQARIHLVGHGIGGVVVRHYAHYRGDGRLAQTISIGTMFDVGHGATSARQANEPALCAPSELLRALALAARRSLGVPHLSVVAGGVPHAEDRARRGALAAGDVAVVRSCAHADLEIHPATARIVERRVVDIAFQLSCRAEATPPIDDISPVC